MSRWKLGTCACSVVRGAPYPYLKPTVASFSGGSNGTWSGSSFVAEGEFVKLGNLLFMATSDIVVSGSNSPFFYGMRQFDPISLTDSGTFPDLAFRHGTLGGSTLPGDPNRLGWLWFYFAPTSINGKLMGAAVRRVKAGVQPNVFNTPEWEPFDSGRLNFQDITRNANFSRWTESTHLKFYSGTNPSTGLNPNVRPNNISVVREYRYNAETGLDEFYPRLYLGGQLQSEEAQMVNIEVNRNGVWSTLDSTGNFVFPNRWRDDQSPFVVSYEMTETLYSVVVNFRDGDFTAFGRLVLEQSVEVSEPIS